MALVSYLISLLPKNRLNRGVPATPQDYKPVKLPISTDALPADLQKRFNDRLTVEKK
jgi:hypothetical protein